MTIIVSGTNRLHSNTAKISEYYQKKLLEKGEESRIIYLTDLPDNLIKTDLYGQRSEGFRPIQELITAADKFIFVVPEYNGSFPGVLKVFIDCCDFPGSFYGKKVALVGHSTGKYGNIRGVEHMTGICHYLNMHVMPLKLHITSVSKELNEKGGFFKEDTLKFTNEQMDRFIEF